LALGMLFGRTRPDDTPAKQLTYKLTARLFREFEEKFGSVNCTELLGCDLRTPEGMARYEGEGMELEKCAVYTEEGARLVARLARK
jgi:hypothetical protein